MSPSIVSAQASNMKPDYEIRLQLDPERVLNSNNQLADAVRGSFSITEDVKMNVQFLDTCSNDIFDAGWIVRLRLVEKNDEFELTYKKRYDIESGKIEDVLTEANRDGFDSNAQKYEAQVEWGYEKQTLSISREKEVDHPGNEGTDLPGTKASRDMLIDEAPDKFDNWKSEKKWGTRALEKAGIFGPVLATRSIGQWEGLKVYVEVWPIRRFDGKGMQYFVEASFKTNNYDEAKIGREHLMEELTKKGWFLPQDALKTSIIMERCASTATSAASSFVKLRLYISVYAGIFRVKNPFSMELLFVDNNGQIDNSTRSAIRRHAAKGLNLGRKITRPSRVKALERRALTAVRSTYASPDTHQRNDEENHAAHRRFMDVLLKVQPVIGDSVSILSLPIEVAQEDRALMYETVAFLGSPRFVPSLAKALTQDNARDSMFVRLIFTDQAYYHCAMAVHLECTQDLPQARISAIRHISRVFRLVNERISNAQQVTNDTMAVVMSLLAYECTTGNYSRGMIHLSGLLRMIETRGGLDCVGSEEPELMQKIYRADLDYALRLGTFPRLETKLFEDSKVMERLDMYHIQEDNAPSGQNFRPRLGPELFSEESCLARPSAS
ncbi:hypothetical protein TARUN_6431 [Trichoderma arundinaceum]|uniref:Uncharacterized protein n=1 Tax=Trichoderma arundinaceum TaxID=490622 RepID=A0A395NIA2_TRIAR|nr:hypothetical protein TARUN_6431 [Trichoderma arundinaceum]